MKPVLVAFILLLSHLAFAYQDHIGLKVDEILKDQLIDLTTDFEGDVGIYVHHLKRREEVGLREHEIFPTASMIKVPIMLSLFDKISAGELHYDQKVVYMDSLFYSKEDLSLIHI